MLGAGAAQRLRQRPGDQGPIPSPTHQWQRPRVRDITMKDSLLYSNRPGRGRISPSNQGQEFRDFRILSGTGVTRSSSSPRAPQGPPSSWLHRARCTGEADAPPPAHRRSTVGSCSALQMLTHGRSTADLLLRASGKLAALLVDRPTRTRPAWTGMGGKGRGERTAAVCAAQAMRHRRRWRHHQLQRYQHRRRYRHRYRHHWRHHQLQRRRYW
jgi:hypothetical protein